MVHYLLPILARYHSMVPRFGVRQSIAVFQAMCSGLEMRYGRVLEEECGQEENLAAYVSIEFAHPLDILSRLTQCIIYHPLCFQGLESSMWHHFAWFIHAIDVAI